MKTHINSRGQIHFQYSSSNGLSHLHISEYSCISRKGYQLNIIGSNNKCENLMKFIHNLLLFDLKNSFNVCDLDQFEYRFGKKRFC